MRCQECQKRPATIHFTKYTNEEKTEVRLCEVCAKEKGYMTYPEESYSLHNLLSGFFNFDSKQMDNQHGSFYQTQALKCHHCGLSLSEFKRFGKFGCAECYTSFSSHLDPILRRVHSGNTKHNGKIPKRQGASLHTKKEIESLKANLQALITQEEFEEAAIVRDKIRELENQMDSTEEGGNS